MRDESAIGATPQGWQSAALGSVADFVNGRAFKPSDWTTHGIPIVRIQNLNGSREFNHFAGEVEPKYEVLKEDLLFSWSGTRGTSFGPHFWRGPRSVLNQHIFNVRNLRQVEKGFLYYALKAITGLIEGRAHGGTGIVHITKGQLEDFRIPVPPLPEQRKIAAILSTVDEAIEKSSAVIDQLEVVKKAVIQELLTRGLPGRHTRFKQTEIGEIPEGWRVAQLGELIADGPANGIYKAAEFHGRGVALLDIKALYQGSSASFHETRRITVTVEEQARFSVQQGDILINRVSVKREGVGKAVVVHDVPEPCVFDSNMMRVRLTSEALPLFVVYFMSLGFSRNWLLDRAKVAAQSSINQSVVLTHPILLPPLDEQAMLVSGIESLERRSLAESAALHQARLVKTVLLNALLSGEIRVPLEQEAA